MLAPKIHPILVTLLLEQHLENLTIKFLACSAFQQYALGLFKFFREQQSDSLLFKEVVLMEARFKRLQMISPNVDTTLQALQQCFLFHEFLNVLVNENSLVSVFYLMFLCNSLRQLFYGVAPSP